MTPSIVERPCLFDLDTLSLSQRLGGPGRARNVFRVLAAGQNPFDDGVLPSGLKKRLTAVTSPGKMRVDERSVAKDGTTKLLVALQDGTKVETVIIPEIKNAPRSTLCVSSQVGCARGCKFCVTATMGLVRNLSVAEIIQQVYLGMMNTPPDQPLRNLVFMGMGEPLDNARNVRTALGILTDHRGYGFAAKHITVSTVGPRISAIEGLKGWPARLAWSLHAAIPSVRAQLVPAPHPNVSAIAQAFATVCAADRRPLFVEMTLMAGLNDRPTDMAAAIALLSNFPTEVRFNLIAMNPGRTEGRLKPSERVEDCQQQLIDAGFFCTIRRPRGQDADAACGQLAVQPTRANDVLVSIQNR
ncbi:MAG: 23S rRNA (adenine(2503)-C(2))-methyltransferase RlmN [Myxococcota bacterium]